MAHLKWSCDFIKLESTPGGVDGSQHVASFKRSHPKIARRSVGSHEIPRIQILMSQDVFLVGVRGDPLPLVESPIVRTRRFREIQLDRAHRSASHNFGEVRPPDRLWLARGEAYRVEFAPLKALTAAIGIRYRACSAFAMHLRRLSVTHEAGIET